LLQQYNETLNHQVKEVYEIAKRARTKGNDPSPYPEIYLAEDVAARVEGLVGPKGVAEAIRELKKKHSDEEVSLLIAEKIVKGEVGGLKGQEAADRAIRAGLAYLTQGVVAAPLEGISRVEFEKGTDGSTYLALYFSGPIRSAGGTAQAMCVLIADYVRKVVGLSKYKPLEEEVGRYIEEVQLYDRFVRLQYAPSEKQIETLIENCPICITGEPTEKIEVSRYRNLSRIKTNQLRGGACLVLAEGAIQKAPKLMKRLKKLSKFGLQDWDWIERLIRKEKTKEISLPKPKYLNEVPAGRPVFAEPATKGAFRLRYGRSRTNGFAAMSMHPAIMALSGDFIAIGTQLRMERPGKATVITACDTIEGPIVRLKSGEVLQLHSEAEALKIKNKVEKILFLGDVLITFGDFLQNNHPLMPSGYCEEWWAQEVKNIPEKYTKQPYPIPPANIALKASHLHPRYTHFWHDISLDDMTYLKANLKACKLEPRLKEILEALGVFHKINGDTIEIDKDHHLVLKHLLKGTLKGTDPLAAVNTPKLKVRARAPCYIGGRMGRPEKAAMRMMKPSPHVLFPTGGMEGRIRDLGKVAASGRRTFVELARHECPNCGPTPYRLCPKCGADTELIATCPKCKNKVNAEMCPTCNIPSRKYLRREIDLASYLRSAEERIGESASDNMKGILGMSSEAKIPEPLEKGILRAKYDLFLFKDGTIRFDSTDMPLTHFKPYEIGTSLEKLREIGYVKDIYGKELEHEEQILQVFPQDILLSTRSDMSGAETMLRTTKFVDELLVKYYGLEPYYNAEKKEDLVGHLVLGLAPHTSAAVVGRIIGFTPAGVGFAHPFFHAAKRRNADGDEDCVMLLLDALLNFSGAFLPDHIGGSMDAPLVLTTILNPYEIDDEVYDLDIVDHYPLQFYEATLTQTHPTQIAKDILSVGDVLNKDTVWHFTHDTSNINEGPIANRYSSGQMLEKLEDQLAIAKKIRAIDENLVASVVLRSHFIPDIKGNLRRFSNQVFRCTKCNAKYRRVPLVGKCTRCGGNLTLTVAKGSVVKYIAASNKLVKDYEIPEYVQQQLKILSFQIDSSLGKDPHKQITLDAF